MDEPDYTLILCRSGVVLKVCKLKADFVLRFIFLYNFGAAKQKIDKIMTTILYAHPYEKSFNHAILEQVVAALEVAGKEYTVLDLYADGFNPAFEAASLALFNAGKTADPLAQKYLDTLVKTNEFIMIFPIWWSTMPAIVDGFFDKVMLAGTAFKYAQDGRLVPDKINISRTVIFSTSEAPTELFRPFFVDYFRPKVLETVGMFNLEWYNCDNTSNGTDEHRAAFLSLVKEKMLK